MALKNLTTNEYLKIDFGYLPQPIAKIFKNQISRDSFDQNFDNFRVLNFNIAAFNIAATVATVNVDKSLLNNFKDLAYSLLKAELNAENVVWEDC